MILCESGLTSTFYSHAYENLNPVIAAVRESFIFNVMFWMFVVLITVGFPVFIIWLARKDKW